MKITSTHIAQVTNTLLRLATLAAKLGLTLYMGRYLSLSDIGTYGLVFGAVMILTTVLGMRFDYVVSRELVGAPATIVLAKMRDQAVFYFINYFVLAIIMIALMAMNMNSISNKVMLVIFIIAVVESMANMTYDNINSLRQPLLANFLFFIRAGLWGIIIAAVGILSPSMRSSDMIFDFWIMGSALSLIITLWTWRRLPWREVFATSVNWPWIKQGVKASFFIWLGALGTTAGFYVDRFIVAENLGLDMAGVATFYISFTAALVTLTQSGVLAFAYPRLITFYRNKDYTGFWHEVRKSGWHVALFSGVIALAIGFGLPLLGHFFNQRVLVDEAPTLWLMLFGMWMKCNAFTLYYILFAQHDDRAIWLGDLLYLIPAFGVNYVLVPMIGFIGIGYGTVAANIFILAWRWYYVRAGIKKQAAE